MLQRINLTLTILFLFVLLFGFLLRFQFSAPITLNEAKESYSAFSLIQTGKDINGYSWPLLFKIDQTFSSTLAVYLRLPFILFGLNNITTRLPSIIIGFFSLVIFYFWLKERFESKTIFLTLSLFILSPLLIFSSVFNLADTLSLTLILLSILLNTRYKFLAIVLLILSIFASFKAIPFIVIASIFIFKNKGKSLLLIPLLLSFLILLNSDFKNFLIKETVISNLLPSNYEYKVDRRLAISQVEESPFYTTQFNFNRFIHNKPTYFLNSFFESLIKPFNFEKHISPLQFQSDLVLEKESFDPKSLPIFFFWEIPLIIFGFIKLLQKGKDLSLALAGIVTIISFKDNSLIYLLPFLVISLSLGIIGVINLFSKKLSLIFIILITLLYIFGYASFYNIFNNQSLWFKEEDLRQSQIWQALDKNYLFYDEVRVTDRVGDPSYYFLYYNNYSPQIYQQERSLNRYKIGNLSIGSFNYFESDRKLNQLWVGVAGELAGRLKPYKDVVEVVDGKVIYKFTNVKQIDKFMGDELWIVETNFSEEDE